MKRYCILILFFLESITCQAQTGSTGATGAVGCTGPTGPVGCTGLTGCATGIVPPNMPIEAQNVPGLIQRYWNYRYFLLGDRIDPAYWNTPGMIIVGDCQGCSLPAANMDPWKSHGSMNSSWCEESATFDNIAATDKVFDVLSGGLSWGEQLWHLRTYLEVLTTEYVQLQNNGYNTPLDLRQTETELYYAIKAVERLDQTGQTLFGSTTPGFVVRDDVPGDFCYTHRCEFGHLINWTNSNYACGYYCGKCLGNGVNLDPSQSGPNYPAPPSPEAVQQGIAPSKDELCAIIEGLYTVYQKLPKYTFLVNSPDPSFDPRAHASAEIINIINYIQNGSSATGMEWVIEYPGGVGITSPGQTNNVCRGASTQVYAWPLWMIKREMEGHGWGKAPFGLGLCLANDADIQTCYDWFAWFGAVTFLAATESVDFDRFAEFAGIDVNQKALDPSNQTQLSAMVGQTSYPYKYWGAGIFYFDFNMTADLATIYGPRKFGLESFDRKTLAFIGFNDTYFDPGLGGLNDETWNDLLGAWMHGYTPYFAELNYFLRLRQHPQICRTVLDHGNTNPLFLQPTYDCNFPAYTFVNGQFQPANGYGCAPISSVSPGPGTGGMCNYNLITFGNSLNWMLTLNLYGLQWGSRHQFVDLARNKIVSFANLMDRNITNTFPCKIQANGKTFTFTGTHDNPLLIQASNSIINVGTYKPGAYVNITAPHTTLAPGTYMINGSTVWVHNAKPDCEQNQFVIPGTSGYISEVRGPTENSDENADELDSTATAITETGEKAMLKSINDMGFWPYFKHLADSIGISFTDWAEQMGIPKEVTDDSLFPSSLNTTSMLPNAMGSIDIFPNPNDGTFKIKLNLPEGDNINICIYDITGRLSANISSKYFPQGIEYFNCNELKLQRGIYIVQASGATMNLRKQIIIQ